jgi:hypothetical protein
MFGVLIESVYRNVRTGSQPFINDLDSWQLSKLSFGLNSGCRQGRKVLPAAQRYQKLLPTGEERALLSPCGRDTHRNLPSYVHLTKQTLWQIRLELPSWTLKATIPRVRSSPLRGISARSHCPSGEMVASRTMVAGSAFRRLLPSVERA